ncbi:MAG TPA: hypothetical protein VF941_00175 [Clostridia bacterium]
MEGWIKLHRAAISHWVFHDCEAWKIWCYCLMDATHTKTRRRAKGDFVNLEPGQTIFGRNEWGKILNIDASKVYRTVISFRDAGMISLFIVGKKYSVLTVLNWTEYQGERVNKYCTKQEQVNEQVEAAENKGLTGSNEQENEQVLNKDCTHNKNVKNEKNNNKTTSDIFDQNSVEFVLSDELRRYILKNNPKAKVPDDKGIQKWAVEIGRMIKLDGRTEDEIRKVMQFSQNDSFWRANILSATKLREKFDMLFLQMNRRRPEVSNVPQANFEQRKYDDSFFEGLFKNR